MSSDAMSDDVKARWDRPNHATSPNYQRWLKKELSEKEISVTSPKQQNNSAPNGEPESPEPEVVAPRTRRLSSHRIKRESSVKNDENDENGVIAGVQEVFAVIGRTAVASSDLIGGAVIGGAALMMGSTPEEDNKAGKVVSKWRKSRGERKSKVLTSSNSQNDGMGYPM